MYKQYKHPLFKLAWSSCITILIFISVIFDYISGQFNLTKILSAIPFTLGTVYFAVSYKLDGPIIYFNDEFDDERIKSLWTLATRNGFYFMMFGIWMLIIFLNEPVNNFVLSNITLILIILQILGVSFTLISFMWYKYRV